MVSGVAGSHQKLNPLESSQEARPPRGGKPGQWHTILGQNI